MKVQLTGPFREAVGSASISIEAGTIRELMRKIEERYPNIATSLKDEVAVSINGQVFRDSWNEKIPPDAEVFLMPRIPGG